MAPGRFQRNFRKVIFQLILVIDGWSISCKIILKWMPMDFTDGKSTLVQVMAWCHRASSHYLSQCWPRSLSPYDVTRPQWVKNGTLCTWWLSKLYIIWGDLQGSLWLSSWSVVTSNLLYLSLVRSRWVMHFIFIRPSLDGTYYGMALSVHPSVHLSVHSVVST